MSAVSYQTISVKRTYCCPTVYKSQAPWPLSFVRWRLMSVGPQFGTCFVHYSGAKSFEVALFFFFFCGKSVDSWFDSRQGQEFFLLSKASKLVVEPALPHV